MRTPSPRKRERRARFESLIADPETYLGILATLRSGIGLRTWALAHDVPYATIAKWIDTDPERKHQAAEARIAGAHALVEESLMILDGDPPKHPSGGIDNAGVNLLKARSEARRWLAARLMPKQYGDSIELSTKATVEVNIQAILELRERRLRAIDENITQEAPAISIHAREVLPLLTDFQQSPEIQK